MLARESVSRGVYGDQSAFLGESELSAGLNKRRACFVTLKIDGQLRGCVGNLEVNSSLFEAVARNSYLAAFRDQRFQPVSEAELDLLEYEISILTPLRSLPVDSEADLLAQIRPGIDGLVFEAEGHRSTFLPSVWEELSQPEQFLRELRKKAGLVADYWSDSVQCWTYQAIKIGAPNSDPG